MSETQVLLGKIAALRQRLEQAQGLAREADTAASTLAAVVEGSAAGTDHDNVITVILDRIGTAVNRRPPVRFSVCRHVKPRTTASKRHTPRPG